MSEPLNIDFIDQPKQDTSLGIDFIDQPKGRAFNPAQGQQYQPGFFNKYPAIQPASIGPAKPHDEQSDFMLALDSTSQFIRKTQAATEALNRGIDDTIHGRFAGIGGRMADQYSAEMDAPHGPARVGSGMADAFRAGLEGSSGGLLARGHLPDVVLDPQNAKWYEKLASGAGSLIGDAPAMVGGFLVGGAAGIVTGPGAVLIGGAAGFAAPTAIREALVNAYTLDQVSSSADFLNRANISIMRVGKDALVGALTSGTGAVVGKAVAPLAEGAVAGGRISATTARIATGTATAGAEVGTMTVAPALLEGRLPEPEDFMNAALLVGGLRGAGVVAGKLRAIYAKTGVEPIQVVADAKNNPEIMADLLKSPTMESEAEYDSSQSKGTTGSGEVSQPTGRAFGSDAPAAGDAAPGDTGGRPELGGPGSTTTLAESPRLQSYQVRNIPVINVNGVEIAGGPRPPYFSFHGNVGTDGVPQAGGETTGAAGVGVYIGQTHATAGKFRGGMAEDGTPNGQVLALYHDTSLLKTVDLRPDRVYTPQEALALGFDSQGESATGHEIRLALVGELGPAGFTKHMQDLGFNGVAYGLGLDGKTPAWCVFDQSVFKRVTDTKGWSADEIARREAFDPTPIKVGTVPVEQPLPRAYRPLAAERAAQDAFSGERAQQVLDHPFADVPETKQPFQLNMRYIDGPEDLKALQTRMADVYQEDINAARGGTQSWAETESKAAQQVADMTGQDLEKVLAGRQPGDTSNAVQLQIMGDILMQATVEAGNAIKAVQEAGVNATDGMKADALSAIHRVAMVQADFTGASSELGRALQYLQRIKELRAKGEGLRNLVDLYGESNPTELLRLAAEANSPEGLAMFAREMNKATTWGKVIEYWKGSVLGPLAVGKKVTSDLAMTVMQPIVDEASWAYGAAREAMGGEENTQSAARGAARAVGNLRAASDALKITLAQMRSEGPIDGAANVVKEMLFKDDPGGMMGNRHQLGGNFGKAIRMNFSALEFITEYFKNLQMRGEAYAMAADEAGKAGLSIGTREFWEQVGERGMQPSEATIDHLEQFGRRMTFGEKLGPVGQAVNKLVQAAPVLEFVVPFRKAPANVIKQEIRLSPLAPFSEQWRADFKAGGETQARALAEMTVGTAIAGLAMSWAASGRISGAGDPDPAKRATQMAAGWQPHSIKIGGKWYSYGKVHPTGLLMGMVADVHDMWGYMDAGDSDKALKAVQNAAAEAIKEQPFLQGVENASDALQAADGKGARFAQNFVSGFVPMGGTLSTVAAAMDPYRREVDSIMAAVMNKVPGLRQNLEPKRDLFGQEIPESQRLLGLSPIKATEPTEDKVRTEAARLGISSPHIPKSIQLPAAHIHDLGKVELTPQQRDVFGDVAGHMAYQVLAQMVNSPGWDYMPDLVKQRAFTVALEKTHKAGEMAAVSDEQRQKEIQRIIGVVGEKLKPPK